MAPAHQSQDGDEQRRSENCPDNREARATDLQCVEVNNPPREYPASHCPIAPAMPATISRMIKLSNVMFMISPEHTALQG
jgi:hypothetical protein